jgi:para-aminobenzoate synthetase component 1
LSATNTNCIFTITDLENAKKKMLSWANQFGIFCFLDNHRYQTNYHSVECLLAIGNKSSFVANAGNALNDLQKFLNENPRWLFGHLGYDLKNEIESVTSSYKSRLGFPDIFFFEPKIIIRLSEKEMEIESDDDVGKIFGEIMHHEETDSLQNDKMNIQQRVSKKEYIETIGQLKKHILRGDCYENNYCMEFFAEDAVVDPLLVYQKLSKTSPNPFLPYIN